MSTEEFLAPIITTIAPVFLNITTSDKYEEMNNSRDLPAGGETMEVPVVGLGTPVFASIHGTAIASLLISIIASITVLVFMMIKTRTAHTPGSGANIFQKLPIGERLVVYLALGDLLFSVTHLVDHALMLLLADNLPRNLCTAIAFFMLSFYYSPSVIALFTAINAFFMVVLQRKLNLGRHDWRLLAVAFGLPTAFMAVAASLGYLGPSGIACSFFYGSQAGRLIGQIFSISMVISFIIDTSCYLLVWMTIRRTVARSGFSGNLPQHNKYHNSAKVMLLFVLAYLGQNWSVAIYYTWSFFSYPHLVMVYLVVTFVNMGGVFNAFAYTFLRLRYRAVEPAVQATGSTELKPQPSAAAR